jgi:hypothetical protein
VSRAPPTSNVSWGVTRPPRRRRTCWTYHIIPFYTPCIHLYTQPYIHLYAPFIHVIPIHVPVCIYTPLKSTTKTPLNTLYTPYITTLSGTSGYALGRIWQRVTTCGRACMRGQGILTSR